MRRITTQDTLGLIDMNTLQIETRISPAVDDVGQPEQFIAPGIIGPSQIHRMSFYRPRLAPLTTLANQSHPFTESSDHDC